MGLQLGTARLGGSPYNRLLVTATAGEKNHAGKQHNA